MIFKCDAYVHALLSLESSSNPAQLVGMSSASALAILKRIDNDTLFTVSVLQISHLPSMCLHFKVYMLHMPSPPMFVSSMLYGFAD